MTYTALDLETVASVIQNHRVICKHELVIKVALAAKLAKAMALVSDLVNEGIVSMMSVGGHPVVYHMMHCEHCGWCPIRNETPHGPYAITRGYSAHLMPVPSDTEADKS
jgi:hypothetical protein